MTYASSYGEGGVRGEDEVEVQGRVEVIDVEKVSKGWERWVVTHLSLPLYLKLFAVCLSVFLGLHLQHMEVLRIGVQSEM